jgi:hypothetical protein
MQSPPNSNERSHSGELLNLGIALMQLCLTNQLHRFSVKDIRMNKFSACILGAVLGITSNLVHAADLKVTFEGITVIKKSEGCIASIMIQEHYKTSEGIDLNNIVIAHSVGSDSPRLDKVGGSNSFLSVANGGWDFTYCATTTHKGSAKVKFLDVSSNRQSNVMAINVDATNPKEFR